LTNMKKIRLKALQTEFEKMIMSLTNSSNIKTLN